MATNPMNERYDRIGKHRDRVRKLKDWLEEYKDTVDSAETLACWCDGTPPNVPMETVDHAIRFADRDLEKLLKNLDQFIVEAKAES